jgi:tetratricopeptide (TPR) repeat protein
MEATIASVTQRIQEGEDLTGALADLDRLLASYGFDDRLVQLKIQVLEKLGRGDEAQRLRTDPQAAVPTTAGPGPGGPSPEYLTVPDLIVQANRNLEDGNLETSLRLLRDAVARQPSNVAALGLLADAAQRAGNWTEAEYAITSALSFQPNNLELKLQLGEVYLAMDAPSSARDVFRQLADQHPHSDRAWASLGLIDARLQRQDRALEALEKAIQENPLLPEVQLAYGELLLKDGRHREALEALRAASNQLNEDPQVLARIGQALLAIGRGDEALPNLRTAVDKGFNGPDVERSLVLAMIRNGLISEAERALDAASLPATVETDILRGLLALARDNLESALGFFRHVAEERPNEAAALNLVAVVLYRQGRYAEAMPLLEQAVALDPADTQIATNLDLTRTAQAAAELGAGAINLGS